MTAVHNMVCVFKVICVMFTL